MKDYNPEYIDLMDVPVNPGSVRILWKKRFDEIPEGQAAMLKYNNRQRAYQMRELIRKEGKYWKVPISTRIIHASPEIHGTDGWLVYFWKKEVEQ